MPIKQTYRRREETRKQKPLLLVVCEDENIEPAYFNKLKENYRDILEEKGNRKTAPIHIVRRAIRLEQEYKQKGKISPKATTWCVFDVDRNTQQQINEALALAKENNICIALSNPCIEFWFLCHYDNPSSRPYRDSQEALDKIIGKCPTYSKTIKKFSGIEDFLTFVSEEENIKQAIITANKINAENENPEKYNISRNPSTTITELIEIIIEEA